MNGYIYARQSSGDNDVSESVELQIEKCKILAIQEGIDVVGISKDLNTSGKTYPVGAEKIADMDISFQMWYKEQTSNKKFRDGLGEVLKHLEEIDYIIVYDITRLYRPINGSHLESYINQLLIFHKIKVLTVSNGIVDVGTFNDSIITALQNRINYEHIKICREKSLEAMKKLKDSGIYANGCGKAFGLIYKGNKQIVFDPEKVVVVKKIFEMILAYKPYFQIIRYINGKYKKQFKKCCYTSNIYHITRNPIYCGYIYNSHGELIQSQQIKEGIISFEKWKKVQEIMSVKRSKPTKARNHWLPVSGLLYCGYSNTKLVSRINRGKIFYSAFIRNLDKSIKTCPNISLHEEKKQYTGLLEGLFPFLILSLIKRIEDNLTLSEKKKDEEAIQVKLLNMKKKEKELSELFLKGLIDRETLEDVLTTHKKERKKLSITLAEISAFKDVDLQELLLHQWNEFHKIIDKELSNDQYEILLKETITKMILFDEYLEVITIFGSVKIPLYLYKNHNKLPKWTIEIESLKKPEYNTFDLRNASIKIRYLMPSYYDHDIMERKIGKLKNIIFIQAGSNV